jgi:hypothetical protein
MREYFYILFLTCLLGTFSFSQNIVSGEYFFNTDPGVGNGTAFSLTAGTNIDENFTVDVSSLSPGFHYLYARVKNLAGIWSHHEGRMFYVIETTLPPNTTPQPDLVSGEWFIDTDPGVGNGTAFSFGTTSEANTMINVDLAGVAPGFHYLYFRVKNSDGRWSHYEGRMFYIIQQNIMPSDGVQPNLVAAEWFVDTDPGHGNGNPISISSTGYLETQSSLDLSGVAPGFHQLYIRVKNENGIWSHYEGRRFYILENLPMEPSTPQAQLIACEWFVDTDPGLGNGTAFSFAPTDSIAMPLDLSVTPFSSGTHHLFIRVKNADNTWSLYEGREFIICNDVLDPPTYSGSPVVCENATLALTCDALVPNAESYLWTGPNNFSQTGLVLERPNMTITMAGTYTLYAIRAGGTGCDTSSVDIEVVVHPTFNETIQESICEGNVYTLNGVDYNTSGTYVEIFASINGCDSIVTLQLTVHPSFNNVQTITLCEGESYEIAGTVYTISTTISETLQSEFGCDSLITTELIFNPVYTVNNPVEICSGGSYTINGNTYTEAGTYTDVLQTLVGCDSTVITELTVVNSFNITNTLAICEGENVTVGTNTYTTAGTYTDLLQSTLGCDSLVTTVLTVNPVHTVNSTVTICEGESITVGSNTYTVSGTYTDVLQSTFGCDSTVVTTLTVTQIQSVNNPQSICIGGSYTINGNTYTEAGTYTDVLQTIAGCDSTVITELTVVSSFDVTNNLTICEGESVTVGTNTYTTAGTYTDLLQSISGCDSLVTTILTVNPSYSTTNTLSICQGESITVGSSTYTTSGTYTNTFQTITGCDSTIVTVLTVNPTFTVNNPQTICEGESYTINGNTYTTGGTYTDVFTSASGCDSTVITELTVNSVTLNTTVSINDATLTSNENNGTYQWIDCDNNNAFIAGATNQSYTATQNGSYAVILTSLECNVEATSSCFNINNVGLETLVENGGLIIYPNPTATSFTIESESTDLKTIRIYDALGKLIFESINTNESTQIDASEWSKGVYSIEIQTEFKIYNHKLVKN